MISYGISYISSKKIIIFFMSTLLYIMIYLCPEEECQELELNARRSKDVAGIEFSAGVSCFSEVIPIMQFIISKLDESQRYALLLV